MDTTRLDDDRTQTEIGDRGMRTTLAAVFAVREEAHDAARELHDEGFRDTWIGLTRSDDRAGYDAPEYEEASYGGPSAGVADAPADRTRVEADNWFMRFFGEGDESLGDALTRHGISAAEARAVGPLPPHSAILTVDGANHPELAAQIISRCGGRLITSRFGATGYDTPGLYGGAANASQAPRARTTSLTEDGSAAMYAGTDAAGIDDLGAAGGAPSSRTASDAYGAENAPWATANYADYDDYGRFRAGQQIDESTRLQLRQERLRVDKSRVSTGEATVGTEVMTETHDIDVPLIREELFIERRPASGAANGGAGTIGGNEVIHVPLSEERVVVTKTPIVTEDVIVGKRDVQNTQHISETTRHEQLNVDDWHSSAAAAEAGRTK